MDDKRYVAAIEISSSKIILSVGILGADDKLTVIATEQDKGVEGVRYGVIQNLEDTSMRIQRLIDKIQKRPAIAPREIKGVFVGLSGRSVRSITVDVKKILPEDTEITDTILAELRSQALAKALDSSLEVVDAIPRMFKVGNIETISPKGSVGNSISATYDLVVCRPELKKNLQRSIPDKLGIRINGAMVTALSVGQLILSREEKRLGCMLVDMGAETTTVTIYKNGHLCYFATLPLGGRHITRDLTSIRGLLEEKAEEMKISSGDAIVRDTAYSVNIGGVKMRDVSNLVVARSEEIVANIVEQIRYANLKEADIAAGIVCIGGASRLRGILELLGNYSGLEVRRGALPNYITLPEGKAPGLEMIEVASVMYTGAINSSEPCLETPAREELPHTGIANPDDEERGGRRQKPERPSKGPSKIGSFWGKIGSGLSSMFGSSDEDDSDLID